jgi:hypothetical protein
MNPNDRPAPTTARFIIIIAATVLAILAVACAPAAVATPSPSAPPSASVPPSASAPPSGTPVTTEAAAALVLATDARFTGIKPKNPDMIGGCCFYEVAQKGEDFTVTIEIGWGDCPAGCIDRHHWTYTVTKTGQVTFVGEDGPAVPAGVPGSVTGTTGVGGGGGGGVTGIRGTTLAGPTCPVVTVDDPNCADRPVAGATIHVIDATGLEVAQMTTDAAGSFTVSLPAGRYQVQADPVEGLMGVPSPTDVIVRAAGLANVDLAYDTGIR